MRKSSFDKSIKKGSKEDGNVTMRIKGKIILERKFNFKIKGLIVDSKDDKNGNSEALVIVTEDGTIYQTNKGIIVTFFPYKNDVKDKLLGYDYC